MTTAASSNGKTPGFGPEDVGSTPAAAATPPRQRFLEVEWGVCRRKQARTREGAEAEAARLTEKDNRMVVAYECHFCGSWHVGGIKVPLVKDTPPVLRLPRRGKRRGKQRCR